MFWRTLAGLGLLAMAVPTAAAKSYTLAEAVKPGDCFRIKLSMKLGGEMRFQRPGREPVKLGLSATAEHEFPERVLVAGTAGLVEKVARVYETARATIVAGKDRTERTLRDRQRLFVCQRHKDQSLVYCPAGPLLRSELELTSEHFDTLSLAGLLPSKAVAVGDTWKVANGTVQALCNFEGLAEQDLTCKLEEANDKAARVSVSGKVSGIDLGALVKLTVTASYRFDLAAGRLVGLEWKQKDDRDQGPASPASTVEATTVLTRAAIAQPASLSDVALVPVPDSFEPPAPMLNLDYQDPKGRFELLYARPWHIVGQTDEHLVMRLLDHGDFVAQVTVAPWPTAEKGKAVSAEEFKQAMGRTPGWQAERELQAGEVPTERGRKIYRLACHGHLDGVEVMQTFYHVASADGRQAVLTFTMTPKQAEHLGTRDLSLVGSLDFPKK